MRVILIILVVLTVACSHERGSGQEQSGRYEIVLSDLTFVCNKNGKDSLGYFPYSMFATFEITNLRQDTLVFASNYNKYAVSTPDYKGFGMFCLVVKGDTAIRFTTRRTSFAVLPEGTATVFTGEYTDQDFFQAFSGSAFEKKLYNYLMQGTFLYAPIVEDYPVNKNFKGSYIPSEIKNIIVPDSITLFFDIEGRTVATYP